MSIVDINMLRDLTNAFGPSGFEEEVVGVIRQYAEGMDLVNDAMNNVYVRLDGAVKEVLADGDCWAGGQNSQGSGRTERSQRRRPVIQLDAHSDECGFMVQGILENGLLSIVTLGGIDLTNIPAHTVIVRTADRRKIKGITTSRPVHFMTDQERNAPLSIEGIYIDVGASSKQEILDLGIRVGDPVMPEVSFEFDEQRGLCFGKAFDNRMGCACILHTMKELKKLQEQGEEFCVDVVGAFAAQEEVGTRGAAVTAAQVQPDLAIVFEGSPADDFYYGKDRAQGALHKGTQIRCMDVSYITNPAFLRYAHELGDQLEITYQDTVRRGGSTNAGRISLAGRAVPTLVLGIPSRYVHTHYNFCAVEDIENTVKMAVEVIRNLNGERIAELMHQRI